MRPHGQQGDPTTQHADSGSAARPRPSFASGLVTAALIGQEEGRQLIEDLELKRRVFFPPRTERIASARFNRNIHVALSGEESMGGRALFGHMAT